VTITGATGLIGTAVVAELRARGAQVSILSRDPERARVSLDAETVPIGDPQAAPSTPEPLEAIGWEPMRKPAPVAALAGRDAIVHLMGEPVAQRWTPAAKRAIRDSRVTGTRQLVAGLREAEPRPRVLISSSAIGYYGAHGEEPLDEEAPAGDDFLAQTCADWEAEADGARELGLRVVAVRTGVVLDRAGGALSKMLPAFKLGVGGPVAGGRQYMSWVHREDVVSMMIAAVEDERWSGPVNATAPEPVTNRDFSRALGHVLHRPSVLGVPGFALRMLYGDMAQIVTTGARVMPAKPLVLGYRFRHPSLEGALRAALG